MLLNQPDVKIEFVHRSSNAGNKITDVHSGLFGETDLVFTDKADFENIDLLYFCTAHGDTKKFMDANELPQDPKIIDLSTDYRLEAEGNDFVYGLPELNRKKIIRCNRVANPGCFATAIQLAILPLANAGWPKYDLHINAIKGSTGVAQQPTTTTNSTW